MKHREKIIRLIKAVVFCTLLICMVCYSAEILERKSSVIKTGAFFSEKENIDVLLLGDSHMRDAVSPMDLWSDYGIVSYNMASGWSTTAVDYWVIKNAYEYTTPKVIVLDGSLLSYDKRKVFSKSVMHEQVDEFPLSINKIKMSYDLYDDWNDRLQFIFKFSLYHSRWDELTSDDFQSKELLIDKVNKGWMPHINVEVPDSYPQLDKNDKFEGDSLSIEYLYKIVEECQERGIDVLLVYLPFPAAEDKQRDANRLYDIAHECGVNYVNFLELDVVDYDTDCYDANSHLNPSGAHKVTDFIGRYIIENYRVPDHREEAAYSSWNDNFEGYVENNIALIREQTELKNYLMMLADKNLSSCIYIDDAAAISKNTMLMQLLENISQYVPLKKLDEAAADGGSYFLIVDNAGQSVYESVNGEEIDISDTSFGNVTFGLDNSGTPYLYIKDRENNYLAEKNDITTVVINKYKGTVEDTAQFTIDGF